MFALGSVLRVELPIRLRQSAGFIDKDQPDLVTILQPDTIITVVAGPETRDNLIWWLVSSGRAVGWMAASVTTVTAATTEDRDATLPQLTWAHHYAELICQ